MPSKPASSLYVCTVVVTSIVFASMMVVNGYYAHYQGLFDRGENETSYGKDNNFKITPASWAFGVWGLIYLWQMNFIIYCIFSLFPRYNFHRVPSLVFPFYILNNLSNIAWLVVAEKNIYWADVGTSVGLLITTYVCLFISVSDLSERDCKFYLYTNAVHNAWAVYAGWTTVATLHYTGIAMIHGEFGFEERLTGTIMLGVLAGELVLFCTLELSILDKHLRHVWAHYIALIVACVGSLYENWDTGNRNTIIAVGIAGFVACAFLVKMTRIFTEKCRRSDRPRIPKKSYGI